MLLLVAVLAVGACRADDATTVDVTPGALVVGAAHVDEDAGLITLPVEGYFVTWPEHQQILNAHTMAKSICGAAKGVSYPYRAVIPEIASDRDYGIWIMDQVVKFGYTYPASPEKQAAVAAQTTAAGDVYDLDQAEIDRLAECNDDESVARFDEVSGTGAWSDALESAYNAFAASDAFAEIRQDWVDCLAAEGIEADLDRSPFAVVGENDVEATESSIALAIEDVRCKQEVDLVQRMGDLEASYEAPVVERYATELTTLRGKFDEQVQAAAALLAANGE